MTVIQDQFLKLKVTVAAFIHTLRSIHLHGQFGEVVYFCCLVAVLCLTLATLWTIAHQAHLSMGFSRQEYWSGLSFPSPGEGSCLLLLFNPPRAFLPLYTVGIYAQFM